MKEQLEFMRGEVTKEREEKEFYKNILMSKLGLIRPEVSNEIRPNYKPINKRLSLLDARLQAEMADAKRAQELKKASK